MFYFIFFTLLKVETYHRDCAQHFWMLVIKIEIYKFDTFEQFVWQFSYASTPTPHFIVYKYVDWTVNYKLSA